MFTSNATSKLEPSLSPRHYRLDLCRESVYASFDHTHLQSARKKWHGPSWRGQTTDTTSELLCSCTLNTSNTCHSFAVADCTHVESTTSLQALGNNCTGEFTNQPTAMWHPLDIATLSQGREHHNKNSRTKCGSFVWL